MYNRSFWIDHVVDQNGNVVQQGTPLDQQHFNNMEVGLADLSLASAILNFKTMRIMDAIKKHTKPLFVISGSYNGGYYWLHEFGEGEPATVEEMVDAFFGGGICQIERSGTTNAMTNVQGTFSISGNNKVNFGGLQIYGGTEAQYNAAISKYLPEE